MERSKVHKEDAIKMVIMPKFMYDERLKVDREAPGPPRKLFMPLGWDEDKYTKRKHYRIYFNDELEKIKQIFPRPSPFNTMDIMRGQTRGIEKGGIMSYFRN